MGDERDILTNMLIVIQCTKDLTKALSYEIRALVSLLPQDKQDEWLRRYKRMCQEAGIDPITGERNTRESSGR